MDHDIASVSSVQSTSEKFAGQDEIDKAGFRISSFILANAWRKCCRDSNVLNSKANSTFTEYQKSHEILEAIKVHYYQKQHENEELTCQIRMTQREIEGLKAVIKEITPKIDCLEEKKNFLHLQFSTGCDECININMQISDLKIDLIKNMEKNKEIEEKIESEKIKADEIKEKCNRLNDELVDLQNHNAKTEESVLKQIEAVEFETQRAKDEKKELKLKVMELKKLTDGYENTRTRPLVVSMELEKALLCQQADILREALKQTFECKLRKHGVNIVLILTGFLKTILPAFPNFKKTSNDGKVGLTVGLY